MSEYHIINAAATIASNLQSEITELQDQINEISIQQSAQPQDLEKIQNKISGLQNQLNWLEKEIINFELAYIQREEQEVREKMHRGQKLTAIDQKIKRRLNMKNKDNALS